jgi:phosphatidylcholine synthase
VFEEAEMEGRGPAGEMGGTLARISAGAVHVFTGLGIICALFATLAVIEKDWQRVFAWLGLAFLIDGIDGTFARMSKVEERLPRFSGERLDQVIDYVTYVFIPVLALLQAGFLPGLMGLALAVAMLLSSLFHFSDVRNKSDDHCFVGFPAIWNIVAFYLFALALPFWAAALLIAACVLLTFVPMRWVHPIRVVAYWQITAAACALWAMAAAWTIWHGFPAAAWAQGALVCAGLYGVGLSLIWPWSQASGDAT